MGTRTVLILAALAVISTAALARAKDPVPNQSAAASGGSAQAGDTIGRGGANDNSYATLKESALGHLHARAIVVRVDGTDLTEVAAHMMAAQALAARDAAPPDPASIDWSALVGPGAALAALDEMIWAETTQAELVSLDEARTVTRASIEAYDATRNDSAWAVSIPPGMTPQEWLGSETTAVRIQRFLSVMRKKDTIRGGTNGVPGGSDRLASWMHTRLGAHAVVFSGQNGSTAADLPDRLPPSA